MDIVLNSNLLHMKNLIIIEHGNLYSGVVGNSSISERFYETSVFSADLKQLKPL